MNSLRNYEIHCLNTISYLPGTYSCAIDCFMELSHKIFMPFLANTENKSTVFQLIYDASCEYDNVVQNFTDLISLLHTIREPVWSHFRNCWHSLAPMNCNALFSEIFQFKNFMNINFHEQKLFSTVITYEKPCHTCSALLVKILPIFVNFIRHTDVTRLQFVPTQWPLYLSSINSSGVNMQCNQCGQMSCNINPSNISPSGILFVEFASDAIKKLVFPTTVNILGFEYHLKGLLRCRSLHFNCAVENDFGWTFFDDLCKTVQHFNDLSSLNQTYNGWFFATYAIANTEFHVCNSLPSVTESFSQHSASTYDMNTSFHSQQPDLRFNTDMQKDDLQFTESDEQQNKESEKKKYFKQYYAKHVDKKKQQAKNSYMKNKEKRNEYFKRQYLK